jgi:hypothetical protein
LGQGFFLASSASITDFSDTSVIPPKARRRTKAIGKAKSADASLKCPLCPVTVIGPKEYDFTEVKESEL